MEMKRNWLIKLSASDSFRDRERENLKHDVKSRLGTGEGPGLVMRRLRMNLGMDPDRDYSNISKRGWEWHYEANGEVDGDDDERREVHFADEATKQAIKACQKRRQSSFSWRTKSTNKSLASFASTVSAVSSRSQASHSNYKRARFESMNQEDDDLIIV